MDIGILKGMNQWGFTGLEMHVKGEYLGEGRKVDLYRDNFGRHRIRLSVEGVGISAVFLHADGEVLYKYTAQCSRGQGLTRQLQAMLTVWGVEWFPSDWQTDAGAACYKGGI